MKTIQEESAFLGMGLTASRGSLLASALAVAFAAGAAQAEELAYARAEQAATAAYEAAAGEAFNAGDPVRISRSATGRYRVAFGRVAGPNANVQVSMLGPSTGYCNVQSWSGGTVNVACFDAANRPADRRFAVLAIAPGAGDSNNLSFAWLNQATPSSGYATQASYTYAPEPVTARRTRAGSYMVRMGAILAARSAVLTTGYGGDAYCAAAARVNRDIVLGCRTPGGEARDSRASVLAIRAGLAGMSFATSTGPGGLHDAYSWSSDGSAQSIARISTGRYRVQLGPEANAGGIVLAGATLSDAVCHPGEWGGGTATVLCHRGSAPADAMFSVVAFRAGSAPRRVSVAQGLWTALLRTAASGLSVRINNFDRSHSQPLDCGPPCPPAFRARIQNDGVIDYQPRIPNSGAPFNTRFTPHAEWRDPYLFLLNDINLISRRIGVAAAGGNRIVLDLPFESEGREVATACHDNIGCGWGEPDGNNKPNAEVDNLVIHIPFVLSVDTNRPSNRIRIVLGQVTYDADIRRAGACHNNALAALCDIFGGDIEGRIHGGLEEALDSFVGGSTEVLARLEAGVNAAMCQLASLQGHDCSALRQLIVESNGDITLIF